MHTPPRHPAAARVPQLAQSLLIQALHLLRAGKHDAVLPLCKQVLGIVPGNFDALYYLGVAYGEIGDDQQAIRYLRQAVRANPYAGETRSNLGKALMNAGQLAEACRVYTALAERAPQYLEGQVGLVSVLRKQERNAEAVQAATAALAKTGKQWQLLNERGLAQAAQGKHHEAALDFEAAAHLNIASGEVSLNLADALSNLKKNEAAVAVLEDLLGRAPNLESAKRRLVAAYRATWQAAKGAVLAQELCEKYPHELELRLSLAQCLVDAGKIDDADGIFRSVISECAGKSGTDATLISALAGFAPIHKFSRGEPEIALATGLMDRRELADEERATLLFALAKMNDDIGEYGAAISSASTAKKLSPPERRFERQIEFVRHAMTVLDAEFFSRRRANGRATTEPVFIIGMPRSGTTLTEQIIASHPDADGAGELTALPAIAHGLGYDTGSVEAFLEKIEQLSAEEVTKLADHYLFDLRLNRKPNATRISDKLPHNFLNVWLVALLFPNAHIIHCRRHPVDVAISIYLREFNKSHSYAVDLQSMGRYLKFYDEVTAHWREVCGLKWYENDYESLVAEPEPNIRRMIDFLGLPWDEKCLAHTETERSVHTFSKWQVRQPIYRTSVERWRKYAPYIKPLLDELGIEG